MEGGRYFYFTVGIVFQSQTRSTTPPCTIDVLGTMPKVDICLYLYMRYLSSFGHHVVGFILGVWLHGCGSCDACFGVDYMWSMVFMFMFVEHEHGLE